MRQRPYAFLRVGPVDTMRQHGHLLVPALCILTIVACGGRQSASMQPVGSVILPGVGIAAPGTMTVGELRQRLLAFADLAMGEMARASAAAQAADSTPDARAFVRRLQAEVASTSVALAVEPDAEAALQDLMVSIAAERASLSQESASRLAPLARSGIDASLGLLEGAIWAIGEEVYAPAELATLRARLKRWQEDGRGIPVGVVRVADLPVEAGPALSKGLFAPLDEANRQLEESRLLGERFLFLAERLPVIALWHAEAVTWEVLASSESRRALEGLALMSSTMERLALSVDSLPALLDGQREALLAAFDTRESAARGLMGDAGVMMADASALIGSGERLAGLSNDAAASLAQALAAAERTIAALRDQSAPGGAMSFEVAAYEGVLSDFRTAADALNGALQRAEGLAGAPRDLIDHAAWRAAQLLMLLFALLAAYRFGPALARRRG